MINLWNTKEDNSEERYYSKGSLNHIASFSIDKDQCDSGQNFNKMKHATMNSFLPIQTQKKKLQLNDKDFARMTSTYMKRGSLDSDQIDIKNELSEKDFVLKEILRRNIVDVTREEDSNVIFYIILIKILIDDIYFQKNELSQRIQKQKQSHKRQYNPIICINLQIDGHIYLEKGTTQQFRDVIPEKNYGKHIHLQKES